MRFNRYILFRCTVREDRLLTKFIREVRELGASIMEVDEEERRVYFRVPADKYVGLEGTAHRYVKTGYYEVRSTSYRTRIPDVKALIREVRGQSLVFDKAETNRGVRVAFVLAAGEGLVLGEASPERGGYVFRLRALRDNINIKMLDPLITPASLYTFYYLPGQFRGEVEEKLTRLFKAESKIRKTLNTILPV